MLTTVNHQMDFLRNERTVVFSENGVFLLILLPFVFTAPSNRVTNCLTGRLLPFSEFPQEKTVVLARQRITSKYHRNLVFATTLLLTWKISCMCFISLYWLVNVC